MNNENINSRLRKLYNSKWSKFSLELQKIVNSTDCKIKPANPLVLSHSNPEKFEESEIKVMILGQENNGWEGVFNGNLDSGLDTCSSFYGGEYYRYRGHFNNHFNLIVNLLKEHFNDKSIGIFWSNVVKVGKVDDKGLPPNYILETTFKEFNVLEDELKIIKPDIILFLSGPDYDEHLESQIGELVVKDFKNYSPREIVELEIPNVKYAYRTYHPNKMNYLGKENYNKIYENIIRELKDIT
jgi:hypothetical protein